MPLKFPHSFAVPCIAFFLCLCGCHSHSSSPSPERRTISPGNEIEIIDSYFNTSITSSVSVVFRNTKKVDLPSFYMDYSISCDNSYKKYDSDYLTFSSDQQLTGSYYTGGDATSCTFTITAIRPLFDTSSYDNWLGSYPIVIQKAEP